MRGLGLRHMLIAALALLAIAIAVYHLRAGDDGLTITRMQIGTTPVTIYRPVSPAAAPVIVIAHGFAGSQQLMQPFAITMARSGLIAVTFDFMGHGRNPQPMRGDITRETGITDALLVQLGEVADVARALPGSDGRLAVLGHSMASDIVIRYAVAHPEVAATVAVSAFSKAATATLPHNLLLIVGAWEPKILRDEALRIVALAAGKPASPGETYGSIAQGTARRMVVARGVEHIGVLYGEDSLRAALAWITGTFALEDGGFIDMRGRWLALLFAALVLLAWPLSNALPRCAASSPTRWPWPRMLVAALGPALLTPLMLWKLPTRFLPILLGDYLTLHFLLYGALTAAAIALLQPRPHPLAPSGRAPWAAIAIAGAAVAAFDLIAFGYPIDSWVFSFWPVAPRRPVIAVVAFGALLYFAADEILVARAGRQGGYALTKFCFLLSLGLAIALNPAKLFFLAIIVPAILVLFLVFGVISRFSFRATHHPLPGAIGLAIFFAWAIGVTFPMVLR